jgi:hypothetical protein
MPVACGSDQNVGVNDQFCVISHIVGDVIFGVNGVIVNQTFASSTWTSDAHQGCGNRQNHPPHPTLRESTAKAAEVPHGSCTGVPLARK